MATITKRGDAYLVRWYGVHGDRRARSCPTRRSAEQLGRTVEEEKANGRDWEPPRPGESLGVVVAAFLRHVARARSTNTLRVYGSMLVRFVDLVGADEPAGKALSRASLANFYDSLTELEESSRHRYIYAVHRLWAWAHDSDEYGEQVSRPRKLEMRPVEGRPTVAPTWAECDACIAQLAPDSGAYRAAVIMRYTGLRVSQACGLVFGDIDTTAGTLRIRGALGKSRAEKLGRIIPVSAHLVAMVTTWGGASDDRIAGVTAVVHAVLSAWRRSGVREDAYSGRPDHAFRKAFVSELRRGGADVDAIEYLVGHSSGIRGVYTDPSALPLRAAVGLVAAIRNTTGSGNVIALRK